MEEQRTTGDYLPPTTENLAKYLREEETEDVQAQEIIDVRRYTSMPEVPDEDVFDNSTDTVPTHWFAVSFCADGAITRWDVNPYAEGAYQDRVSIRVGPSGPAC